MSEPKLIDVGGGLHIVDDAEARNGPETEPFGPRRDPASEELREIGAELRKPVTAQRRDYPNLMLAIGLEALYRQTQEHIARQGHILSRKEFMALGFSLLVPAPTLLQLMQRGLPFMLVQQPQPPGQVPRNPLSIIKRG